MNYYQYILALVWQQERLPVKAGGGEKLDAMVHAPELQIKWRWGIMGCG